MQIESVAKKGVINEIFSKARFGNEIETYKIFYRDFEKIVGTTLPEFIKVSENFETIPISRIEKITKNNAILFEKNTKDNVEAKSHKTNIDY